MVRSALLLVALLFGCPDLAGTPVPGACTKQYEKCKLPSGPLGVCDVVECPSGERAPCFKCMPQH